MSVEITHDFVSPVADAPESPDEVTPTRWNAPHVLTQGTGAILGRVDADIGPTTELTPAQVRTLINVEDGATAGGGGSFFETSEEVTTAASPMWQTHTNDIANRAPYDDELTGFTLLVYPDSSNDGKPTTYTKLSDTTADWGPAVTIAQIDPSKYITYVTTSGSDTSEPLFLTTSVDLSGSPIAGLEVAPGIPHVVVFRTKTGVDDKVLLVGDISPDRLVLEAGGSEGWAALAADGGATGGAIGWRVIDGNGLFTFEETPSSEYPVVYGLNGAGNAQLLPKSEYADFYRTEEALTVDGDATCSSDFFLSQITSDGTGGPNTVNFGFPNEERQTAPKRIVFAAQTDPADTLVISAGETFTLPNVGAWLVGNISGSTYLPWSWGGGTTTDYVGTRTLQLSDTGELSWV